MCVKMLVVLTACVPWRTGRPSVLVSPDLNKVQEGVFANPKIVPVTPSVMEVCAFEISAKSSVEIQMTVRMENAACQACACFLALDIFNVQEVKLVREDFVSCDFLTLQLWIF